jgi:hypothetical protein
MFGAAGRVKSAVQGQKSAKLEASACTVTCRPSQVFRRYSPSATEPLPVPLQAARHFFPARHDPVVFQIRQFPGIPIPDSDVLEFVCGENEKDRAHLDKR